MAIDLVVFDLGNVLVRICASWLQACDLAGVARPSVEAMMRQQGQLHDAACRADRGELDVHGFAAEVAPAIGLSPAEITQAHHHYLRGPFVGAAELLSDLRRAGVSTACLSNTNENHWRIMSSPPYRLDLLDHRIASHLVGVRKPDPGIYAHLEAVTGRRSGSVLFFDDLPENVEAARERGWHAVVVPVAENDHDPVPFLRQELREMGVVLAGRATNGARP